MTTTKLTPRAVEINYSRVLMLPTETARDWVDENFVDASEGWVGIHGDRAYITHQAWPIRLGPGSGQDFAPLPEALVALADVFLVAEAMVGDDCWGCTARLSADADQAKVRETLGWQVMGGIEKALNPICACGERARSAIDVDGTQDSVCLLCAALQIADGASRDDFVPLITFTERDAG